MKMTKIFAMALPVCAGALLAGCSDAATEEEIAPTPAATTHTIFANILNDTDGEGDDTRTFVDSVDHFRIKWETGDEISYFNQGDAEPTKAILNPDFDGDTYGKFEFNGTAVGGNNDNTAKYGVFPYNAKDRVDGNAIQTELPAEQTYDTGSYGGQNLYMAAFIPAAGGTGSLNFQSYHSGLGVYVKGSGTGFKIIVTSEGDQYLAGKVSISTPANGGAPKATVTNGSKKVTFDCSDITLTDQHQPFWIALLPDTYTKLRIQITDPYGKELFNRTASNLTLTQKKVKRLKVDTFFILPDHTKNPLAKWATADLIFDWSTETSTFASSYTDQGSLYQWGRNVGWSDYEDAMGGQYVESGKQYPFWLYCTYGQQYNTGKGYMYYWDQQIKSFYYAESSELKDMFYFMNPNGSDYWHSTFGDGGSTWNERAKKCGFTANNGSPCPAGYHMPSKAEFLEIKPTDNLSGSGSLASVLNNSAELKTINGTTYAMRWSAETVNSKTYLRIDALVVPNYFEQADLSKIDWENNSYVVTRYFGTNGYIDGFYHTNSVIMTNGDVLYYPIARPMPGLHTREDKVADANYSDIGYRWTMLWKYITDYSVNNEGYYWMSDEKTAFTFQDNTRIKTARKTQDGNPTSTYAFPNRLSILKTLPIDAQDCCSIRCVKD